MSTRLTIEDEAGTITRPRHPHNGYYAGDFFRMSDAAAVSGTRDRLWTERPVLRARS
jgi:hypothetical protein